MSGLNFILFEVGRVHFGIDAEQVLGISAFSGTMSEHLLWFHQLIDFGATTISYRQPIVMALNNTGGTPNPGTAGVIIDTMEEIVEVSVKEIQPFPRLLTPLLLKQGMWGVLPWREKMVILLDCNLLPRFRTTSGSDLTSTNHAAGGRNENNH